MLAAIKRATGEDVGQEDGPDGRSQRSTTCDGVLAVLDR
jgi:hypothetical protein